MTPQIVVLGVSLVIAVVGIVLLGSRCIELRSDVDRANRRLRDAQDDADDAEYAQEQYRVSYESVEAQLVDAREALRMIAERLGTAPPAGADAQDILDRAKAAIEARDARYKEGRRRLAEHWNAKYQFASDRAAIAEGRLGAVLQGFNDLVDTIKEVLGDT